MTREEKITAIYKEMANKEDSFWLRFIAKFQDYKDKYFDARELTTLFWREDEDWKVFREAITDGGLLKNHYYLDEDAWYIPHIKRGEVLKIIWHPVMIGDVMQYLEDKSQSQIVEHEDDEDKDWFYSREAYYEDVAEISDCWRDKRLSIDEQSDECIDYVYSLIPSISMG